MFFRWSLPFFFLRQFFSLTWKSARLANQQAARCACLCLPKTGITSIYLNTSFLLNGLWGLNSGVTELSALPHFLKSTPRKEMSGGWWWVLGPVTFAPCPVAISFPSLKMTVDVPYGCTTVGKLLLWGPLGFPVTKTLKIHSQKQIRKWCKLIHNIQKTWRGSSLNEALRAWKQCKSRAHHILKDVVHLVK